MSDPGKPAAVGTDEPARAPLHEWSGEEADLLRGLFLEEAEAYLVRVRAARAALAGAPLGADGAPATEAIDALYRPLHTLKGSAGSVGFDAISRAAHELEDVCAEMRTGRLALTPGVLDQINEGVATLGALLDGARAVPAQDRAIAATPVEAAADERRLGPDRRGTIGRRQSEQSVRVESERLHALLEDVGDLVILRTRIERRLLELDGVSRDLAGAHKGVRALLATLGGDAEKARRAHEAVPAPAARLEVALDRLSEIEGELASGIVFLERAARALGGETESLRRTADDLEQQVRRARRVPLDWALGRMAPALRELERATGRRADIAIAGGEVELDRAVVEHLVEPLLHLLRNAVAHGIEPAAERRAAGKPEIGRIQVAARQVGEVVVIAFEDDGRGIDRDRVHEALVRAGRIEAHAPLSDAAAIAAIFEPGFSVRTEADALAGRGMGLNIVRKATEGLGGDVGVEFRKGEFARFRLVVPVSAAITQAVLFKVGGQVYALPASSVTEAVPVAGLDRRPSSPAPAESERQGAGAVPVLRLHALLGVESFPARHVLGLKLRHGERSFVVTCDKVIGPRTVVVRPLGPLLAPLPLYAGVTISGAGKAQLVLDVAALAQAATTAPAKAAAPSRRGQPRVLVVDDSRAARDSTARALAASGYQIVTAEDGWAAWEALGERRFDVMVTDLDLPRLGGLDLIRRIRRERTLRELRIVVQAPRPSPATRDRALWMGAHAVVAQAPNRRQLVEAVGAMLADAGERGRPAADA